MCEIHQNGNQEPEVNSVVEILLMVVERLRKGNGAEMGRGWIKAAEEGRRGNVCREIYKECQGEDFEGRLLQQLNSFREEK